jgi:dienelactone hydrolase
MKTVAALPILLLALSAARAAIRTEVVEYRDGDTVLEGYVAYDDAKEGRKPGVLVVHQWMGPTAYEKKRCEMLAELGYVAFAADIYGKGVRPANPGEAGKLAGGFKSDRPLLRRRVNAAFSRMLALERCDAARTAAIGYCFGGTTVLELARSGTAVGGVVSFHGGLSTPTPADAAKIRGRVLALHGADDPFVPPKEVAGFEEEMRAAKCDWQFVAYGGAVHSFTHWTAGDDNSKGAAYNEKADRRSWAAMREFLSELFR